MSDKLLNETVYDAVVVRAWLIPGPGSDFDNPCWLASYTVQGAADVVMRGEGVETYEEAALQAVNTVRSYLMAQIARMPPSRLAPDADADSKPR